MLEPPSLLLMSWVSVGWAEGSCKDQPKMCGRKSFLLAKSHHTGDTEKKMFLYTKSRSLTPPWVRPVGSERTGSAFDAIQSQTSYFPILGGPCSPGVGRDKSPNCPMSTEHALHCWPRPTVGCVGSPSCPQGANVQRQRGVARFVRVNRNYSTSSERGQEHAFGSRGNESCFKEQVS